MEQPATHKAASLGLGMRVFLGLMVLTVLEYWIATVAEGPAPYPAMCFILAPITWAAQLAMAAPLAILAIIAVIKAAMIAYYFMHVLQLWRGNEHEEAIEAGEAGEGGGH